MTATALQENISQEWKCFPQSNALAYHKETRIMVKKVIMATGL
jgi:hypothetical protein